MGRKPRQATGRGTVKERQETGSTAGFVANGFLKQQFLPLYQCGKYLPEQDKAEQGLKQSLSILSEKGIEVIVDYKNKNYPYNMLLVQADLQQQMGADKDCYELSIVSDDADNIFLSAREVYDTGTTLYFIPVLPLCRLMKQKKHRQAADLLLSVFAYLYHVVGVPYYRDNYSALNYYYEMTEEWLRDDIDSYEPDDQNRQLSELNKASHYGDLVHRKIYNSIHLNHMSKRLNDFTAKCAFDLNCFQLAQSFHQLAQQFPNAGVFDNIPELDEDATSDDQVIRAQQYVSFIADTDGWLYENITDMLNNQFNECGYMEQPTIIEVFTEEAKSDSKTLDFEKQLFPLIADLCILLNEIP
ncbi:hypothetical protein [Mucilaginibacter boryungensis]|uniref:PRTRC genetic system protein F n=1 Tax=Mucilaginibacter boryungensis TaxID=768480 RepID=A0ABR9XL61_9SPHI|nr:hypothetical protein [Mucilaginibacter boryungensis]MBE9668103.1 hypothetical protein [Mucilaginibacter boryungensis]